MNLIFRNFWNTLRRYKAASILNILGLSVAFAAFAIIMMQVRYDLTFDRFHSKADRIFRVEIPMVSGYLTAGQISRPMARELMASLPGIVRGGLLAGRSTGRFSADGQAFVREPTRVFTMGLLDVFDFRIVAGDTARLREPATRMISRSTATRLYGETDPIGRRIFIEGATAPAEVVAVYADFPDNSTLPGGVWGELGRENYDDWSNWNYQAFVELASEDPAAVEADLRNYIASLYKNDGADEERLAELLAAVGLSPLADLHFQSAASRPTVYTLLSIAVLIVLIAAINFVNFATAMVPRRLRAVNTQRVLGNPVGAIRAAMIFESVGLALVGLGLGCWLVHALSTTPFTSLIGVDMAFGKNLPVLVITAAVALATGLLAGLYPAFYITSFAPALVIKGLFGLSPAGKRLRTALISVQYVISIGLIVAALFMQIQNRYMKNYPTGFERDNILQFNISQDLSERPDALRGELMKNPSIRGVAYAGGSLVREGFMSWGRENGEGEEVFYDVLPVSVGFPELLGMEIVEGRSFRPSDERSENGVYLFNETAKNRFRLTLDSRIEGHRDPAETAGFVRDFNFKPLRYGIEPFVMFVFGAYPWNTLRTAYVRVDGANVAATREFIHETVRRMDPDQVEVSSAFLDERIGGLYAAEDRLATLVTIFSALAVLISLIGVFGLVLFETQYRRREIGLRRVHGATVGGILGMFNRRFAWIVLACFAVAAPIAYYAVRQWLDGFAYQSPVRWWIFAAVGLGVAAITAATVTAQSWRAANENPVNSIKTE